MLRYSNQYWSPFALLQYAVFEFDFPQTQEVYICVPDWVSADVAQFELLVQMSDWTFTGLMHFPLLPSGSEVQRPEEQRKVLYSRDWQFAIMSPGL